MKILNAPQPQLTPAHINNQSVSAVKSGAIETISDQAPRLSNNPVQEVIFIGRGSSITYALTEVCDRYEGQSSTQSLAHEAPLTGRAMVIGSTEPWSKEVRGSGFINHQNELIDTWGDKAPQYNKEYADRQQFSDANTAQIDRAVNLGVQAVNDEVLNVKKDANGLFTVTTAKGDEFVTKQVILGIGAGPHTNALAENEGPTLTTAEKRLGNINVVNKEALKSQVVDLDEFMRLTDNGESLEGKTVVVHGPNAGIDAVERAGSLGAEIKWFIRSTAPVLLDGNQLEHAPKAAEQSLVKVDRVTVFPDENGKIKINYSHNNKEKTEDTLQADYYVYALGQDSQKQGAVNSVLDASISQHLEPIYDIDQIYSDKPYNTVLGIQTKDAGSDNGLIIVGASVAQMAGSVKHTYLSQVSERINGLTEQLNLKPVDVSRLQGNLTDVQDEVDSAAQSKSASLNQHDKAVYQVSVAILKQTLSHYHTAQQDLADAKSPGVSKQVENVVNTEVASVVVSPQLATVKASIGALSNIIPQYISEGEVNYSSDNRTMLRVSLANDFPNIPDVAAEQFIQDTIDLRVMNKRQFEDKIATDLLQYVQELLQTDNTESISSSLTKLHVQPNLVNALIELLQDNSLVRKQKEQQENALKEQLVQSIETKGIPAWGTAEEVRYGYASKLSDLHLGVKNETPLSLFWLGQPISELNALRV
ncbi:restriction endonuclease [Shewanella sp. VB17]|uniref:restriction endonuclease n=1 Tax=Shewanella sp. VB17 TaxID=2739432 RepID=UPI0015655B91|nr:restriction endonuclease [Shewanella sp. VB17]NRD71860.1 restriction endonuclease [Shewanella sp. VB17]